SLAASLDALAELGAESGDFHRAAAAIATRLEGGASDRAITRLAATGSIDAMLNGSLGGVNAAGRATTGVSTSVNGALGSGTRVVGGVTGSLGGVIP
ncbi:MAG TPA: hypothetical protein VF746_20030, partial [Longimicrobium sp.]